MSLVLSIAGYLAAPALLTHALFWIALQHALGRRRTFDPLIKLICRACLVPFGIRVRRSGRCTGTADACLYMANHVSILDPILLFGYLPGDVRGVELEDHFSWPLWGTITRVIGNIPISHRNMGEAVASLDAAAAMVRAGTSVVILPEGHRTRDGRLGRFMRGPFRLAFDAQADIAPIGMAGLYERKNVHSPRVRPGTVVLAFGGPIRYADYSDGTERDLRERVRAEIDRLLRAETDKNA